MSPVINSFLPSIYWLRGITAEQARGAPSGASGTPRPARVLVHRTRLSVLNQAARAVEALEHVISLGGAASIWVAPLS